MSKPDEVTLGVEGDFGDLIDGDSRIVGVVGRPFGLAEADQANVTGGCYPFSVVGIDLHVPKAVARKW